jgi:tetratricopeptide (TPR) repeat protein
MGQSTSPPDLPVAVEVPVTVDSARDLLMRGREQQAVGILQKLVAQRPPAAGAHRELGIAYYRMGKLMGAETSFAAATEEEPNDLESIQMRGLTLYRLGRPNEALPYLKQTRNFSGTADMDINYVLGRCYITAHLYDDARAAFAAQYGLNPQSGEAYALIAQLLLTLELAEPAAEAAQKALTLAPNVPLAHFALGKIYLAKGDFTHALSEFERERALNPTYPALYQFLGDLYLRMGDKPKAQQALTQALSLDTSNTGPFNLMGRLFLDKNDPQTAAGYLEHAEQMDPRNFMTHYMLGQAYRQMGRHSDAKRELDIVSKIHSEEIRAKQ